MTLPASRAHPAGLPVPSRRRVRNAQACHAVGAGIALIGSEASTNCVEVALRRALNDAGPRRNVECLATEIAGMSSLDDAITALEHLR